MGNAITPPNDGFRIKGISKPETRTQGSVVNILKGPMTIASWTGAIERDCSQSTAGRRIGDGGVEMAYPIIGFPGRSEDVIAQPIIQSQFARDAPLVLSVEPK